MRLLEEVNTTKGNAGGCGEAGQVLSLVVVAVTFYRYYKKKAKGEVNYRWRTRCPELVDKIVKHRTKVFTGQLIQLAKVYGEKKVIKYQKEEEEVCQNTIETL